MLLFILAFLNGYDIMFIYFCKTINLNMNRQGSEDYTMDRHGLVCRAVLEQPDITQRELAGKDRIDIVYYPDINEYNGNRTLQAVIRNYKAAG